MSDTIYVFGGTFDPFSLHHQEVVTHLLDTTPHDVMVVPSAGHPIKDLSRSTLYHHRLHMAKLALAPIERVEIVDERSLFRDRFQVTENPKILTIDLLLRLRGAFPEKQFKFAIGEDLKEEVSSWEGGKEVGEQFGFAFISARMQGVHNTQIRRWMREGDPLWRNYVPPAVVDYIVAHGLFGVVKS